MTFHSLIKTLFYRAGFSVKKLRVAPRDKAISSKSAPIGVDLMELLHAINPYTGFDYQRYPYDPSGWGSNSPIFRKLIETERPKLIVEVGTWKGGSAIHMAGILQELQLPSQILCIDTWLGALEFWNRHENASRYEALSLRNGYPSVYFDFVANVCHAGHQQRIVPFPQTSAAGALWLRSHGVCADFIYLDASHEEEDVYGDLVDYWEVLAPGGVLLGDDWPWDGVRLAAQRFAAEHQVPLERFEEKWHIRKPR